MQQGAPLDIRVNTLLAGRDDILQQLHDKNIDAPPRLIRPSASASRKKIPLINRDALFTEGKIEVQDEGSQLLGFLLAPRRNDMVVDFCAGAGGKTLMLSALMNSQGRLYAMDVSEKRLANLKPRLKRSGASNITADVDRARERSQGKTPGRQDRPRAGGCAVQRVGHAAPQPGS